ncbi:MAG: RNA polymerase sigma factor [Acidobacteria bacterium]|nr:RNA polymerase sigma factor [Acidobacteriota bacterium]
MCTDVDAQMMLGAKKGDAGALETLVQKHRGPIMHYMYRMVRNRAVSEELAQEVFLKVHRHRESYEATAKFTTWLYRIASHLALNWLRDHGRERLQYSLDAQPPGRTDRYFADTAVNIDEWMILRLRIEEVRQAVNELPPRQRTVVLLHKFEGLECSEIGELLGCSCQAVRSLLCRAYATLRARLAHVEAECCHSKSAFTSNLRSASNSIGAWRV